jgi:hypothetical protein
MPVSAVPHPSYLTELTRRSLHLKSVATFGFSQFLSNDSCPATRRCFVRSLLCEGRSVLHLLSPFGLRRSRQKPAGRRSPTLRPVLPVQLPVATRRKLSTVPLAGESFLPPRIRHYDRVWPSAQKFLQPPVPQFHCPSQFHEQTSRERRMKPHRFRHLLLRAAKSRRQSHWSSVEPTTRSDRKRARCYPMRDWPRPRQRPLRRREFLRHCLASDAARCGQLRWRRAS